MRPCSTIHLAHFRAALVKCIFQAFRFRLFCLAQCSQLVAVLLDLLLFLKSLDALHLLGRSAMQGFGLLKRKRRTFLIASCRRELRLTKRSATGPEGTGTHQHADDDFFKHFLSISNIFCEYARACRAYNALFEPAITFLPITGTGLTPAALEKHGRTIYKTKSCRKGIPMLVGISAVSITLPLFFCENNLGRSNLLNSATWKTCWCGGMMAAASRIAREIRMCRTASDTN